MGFNLFKRNKKFDFGCITYFSFSYSTGNMCNAFVNYGFTCKNGEYKATVKPSLVAPEDERAFTISSDFVARLASLLKENRVNLWDGFNKADKRVLDGNHFSFYIKNARGESISAHGYMKWPNNYGKVKKGVDELFISLVNDPVMMVNLYISSTATVNGDCYTEYVLSTCENKDFAVLDKYIKEQGEETKASRKVPYKAITDCMEIINKYDLAGWNDLEDPICLDGARTVCKFWNGEKHIRVSTDSMPQNGLEILNEIRNVIEEQ